MFFQVELVTACYGKGNDSVRSTVGRRTSLARQARWAWFFYGGEALLVHPEKQSRRQSIWCSYVVKVVMGSEETISSDGFISPSDVRSEAVISGF